MFVRSPRCLTLLLLAILFTIHPAWAQDDADDSEVKAQLQEQVDDLVLGLGADTIAERDIAEQNLIKLGEAGLVSLEDYLAMLPKPTENMPPAIRDRITSIRSVLETRRAKEATAGSKLTLTAAGWKLSELLDEIEKKTGNKVVDARDQFGQDKTDPNVTVVAEKLPFWSVLDQALDQAKLDLYGYGDDAGALQLMDREPGRTDRYGRATYSGPFRFETTDIVATRGLRNKSNEALQIGVEVAWEPKQRPIVLTLPIDSVTVSLGEAGQLATTQPGRVFSFEIQPGTQSQQFTMPFSLPDRSATEIESLKGTLLALLPGSQEEFVFDDLTNEKAQIKTKAGVEVTLNKVEKNNAIWEVHMKLKLADAKDALASHRGWVFGNITYMQDADGNVIDHAGFETTMQTEDAVGIAYLFDLPDGIEGLRWVYKTPAAIVEQSFPLELGAVELP